MFFNSEYKHGQHCFFTCVMAEALGASSFTVLIGGLAVRMA